MSETREEFEKLPVVAGILSNHVFWHDECEQYQASDDDTMDDADWLNGAWYMYKEQQKKIDEIVSIVRDADLSDGDSSVAIVHDEIQELLKSTH